jgi:Fe2+ transport system protein FeoA
MSRSTVPSGARPVPLTQLTTGSIARLHATELGSDDCALLRALGLTDQCVLRVCKAGEPCIVQVRATRIGLSKAVARGLFVIPEVAA